MTIEVQRSIRGHMLNYIKANYDYWTVLGFIRSLMRFEVPLQHAQRNEEARRIHQQLLAEAWPVAMLWDRQYYFSRASNSWLGSAAGLRMTRSLSTAKPSGAAAVGGGK